MITSCFSISFCIFVFFQLKRQIKNTNYPFFTVTRLQTKNKIILLIKLITYLLKTCNRKTVTTGYRRLQKTTLCNRCFTFVTVTRLQQIKSYKPVNTEDTEEHNLITNFFVTVGRLQVNAL